MNSIGQKWANLIQMTIIFKTVGKNPLEEMQYLSCSPKNLKCSSPHSQQKDQNAVLQCNLKNSRMISIHFQGKPPSITVIQVYALTTDVEEAEVEWFYEELPSRTNTKEREMSFS